MAKNCCIGCLQNCLASCCLVLMAGVSFTFFGLTDAISGGLFVNTGDAISGILGLAFGSQNLGTLGSVLIGGLTSIVSILIFPMHWILIYRPEEAGMAFAMMIPWVLAIGISALLFAKSAKDGLLLGVWLAAGYIFLGLLIYILLAVALRGTVGPSIINGLFGGLTDLHPVLAIILASLEGGLLGGAFGAFIGALKYKPGQQESYKMKPKKGKRKKKKEDTDISEMTFEGPPSTNTAQPFDEKSMKKCPYCGANLKKDDTYCLSCNNYLG